MMDTMTEGLLLVGCFLAGYIAMSWLAPKLGIKLA